MVINRLDKMLGGWFIGDFSPAAFRTANFEVGVKHYKKGDKDLLHYHQVAQEITCLIKGTARMGEKIFREGDIILLNPCESVDFEALDDLITVVVKVPSAKNDKFLGEPQHA